MLPPGPLLVLDASAPTPLAGVWRDGAWLSFVRANLPPAESLFDTVAAALAGAGTGLSDLSGYIYVEGPGSVLGLRSAAMALRVWTRAPGAARLPVFTAGSPALAVSLARTARPELATRPFTVIAAARRDRWNVLTAGDPAPHECDTAALATLPAPLLKLPAREFVAAPADVISFDPASELGRHPEVLATPGLLRPTDSPDAANIANTYVTWTGERHRAAAPQT